MGRIGLKSALVMARRIAVRLARDQKGNTLAMVAAGIVPLLAMVGGGIDMGRSYLSQSRLQQACDAGVLAARKKLGTALVATGEVPDGVADVGNRFFNINFRAGAYGTDNRDFAMTLENDTSISGVARADVPTTIMKLFGYTVIPVEVECEARLNFSNTDIMMVLDTTKSMDDKANDDDTQTKIEALRATVKSFYSAIKDSSADGTTLRVGFVPYSTNVNVGGLLKSDWMVDEWAYQSRTPRITGNATYSFYSVVYEVISGSIEPITPYPAETCPINDKDSVYEPTVTISTSPHSYYYYSTTTGGEYWCNGSDGMWMVNGLIYNNYRVKATWTYAYDRNVPTYTFDYRPVTHDVTRFKGATGDELLHNDTINVNLIGWGYDGNPLISQISANGCIEERSTYEIDDYANVDFSRALDLDIDLVPDPSNPDTQWRPHLPGIIFAREKSWDGRNGDFVPAYPKEYGWDYFNPHWRGFASCPSPASKLAEMSVEDVGNYVDSLLVEGETHHDIGMIWGGRLLSRTGLFAAENADVGGKPTSRHLIFLTDGQTMPLPLNYDAYGMEPLDRRRWNPEAPVGGLGQTEVVEERFSVACQEVRKRNITVWVVGFGTEMTEMFRRCAGDGHWFQADDAAQLQDVFESIANSMGDLRISR